jgi:PAS domain S-box-containing protein
MNKSDRIEVAGWQWRQIVDGATETAIISTDNQGRVTSWNSGATNILGWTEQEMIGQSLSRIFTDEDPLAHLIREIDDALSKGKGGGDEGWRRRKDGSVFWAVGELSPIYDRDRIVGFIKILRNRTDQRNAEEEIREERLALEILYRANSALALETDHHRLVQIVTDAGV